MAPGASAGSPRDGYPWSCLLFLRLFLAGCVARLGLGVHRIEAGQCRAVVPFIDDPGSHPLRVRPLGPHMTEQPLRDQLRAVQVGDDDVVREYRDPTAADRLTPAD